MKKIVAIGGGTGLSSLLRGLKKYPVKLTAIVAVTDEGGSSGRLRKELKIIPPGDIRNCLVALSEEESLMSRLFQYRFENGTRGSLKGHSFGNLFLAALAGISGGFGKGVAQGARVLLIKGEVLPVTLSDVRLKARLENGDVIYGEKRISSMSRGEKISEISLVGKNIKPNPLAVEAIKKADCVVVGPGSLYTSIITNMLVPGIGKALKDSRALKVYVANIMTQPGETDGYTLSEHIKEIKRHTLCDFDAVIVDESPHDKKLLKRYASSGAFPVVNDLDAGSFHSLSSVRRSMKSSKSKPVIIRARLASSSHYARHDPDKLSRVLMRIITD